MYLDLDSNEDRYRSGLMRLLRKLYKDSTAIVVVIGYSASLIAMATIFAPIGWRPRQLASTSS